MSRCGKQLLWPLSSGWRIGRVAVGVLAIAGSLAACGLFGGADRTDRPGAAPTAASAPAAPSPRPPLPVVRATGETVTLDDARSGSPVELRLDQQLVVRLHYEISSSAQWELTDFIAGALATPAPPRFDTQNGEAASLLGGDQVWRFKPAAPGQTVLNFAYRTPRSRDAPSQTASFVVTVR